MILKIHQHLKVFFLLLRAYLFKEYINYLLYILYTNNLLYIKWDALQIRLQIHIVDLTLIVQMHIIIHLSTCRHYQTYVVGLYLWYLAPLLAISDYNYPFGISKLFLRKK